LHEQVFEVVFKLNVGKHAVIFPVRSAHDAALAGHLEQTLLPGLKLNSGQTVIATHADPV
jgi:hypothetical protein